MGTLPKSGAVMRFERATYISVYNSLFLSWGRGISPGVFQACKSGIIHSNIDAVDIFGVDSAIGLVCWILGETLDYF